jgi:hypothetical protein
MVRTRWLLVLRAEPDQQETGLVYGLWLYTLDEQRTRPPRRCATVEELFAALFADTAAQRDNDS